MASVKIRTPSISENVRTFLSTDYTSGTNLGVLSSTDLENGMYVVVGEPNGENTEITSLIATPPNNTSLTVNALNFSHPAGTPVTYVDWDKYELSYRTSSSSAWVVYPSMPDNLIFDALYKEYRDSAATSTYEWRYRYYSTEKSAYSDYSDTVGTLGWPSNSVGYMVREIRKIVNDPEEKTVKDIEIIRFLNSAQQTIYTLYDRWWFLLKIGTAIPTVVGQKTYAMPSDFGRMHTVQLQYVSGSNDITYNLRYLSMPEFDYQSRDNNQANDDNAKYYGIYPPDSSSDAGYLRIWPKPLTAGLNIIPVYYKVFTDLATYADETEVPVPDILENYVIAQILQIRKEDDKAKLYDQMFKEQIQLLKLMQRKSARPMRSLWSYKGVNAEKRMFGTRDVYSDTTKEQYW